MLKTVKTENGKTYKFKSTAATPIWYYQIFGKDLLIDFQDETKTDVMKAQPLAFVMAKQAANAKMNELNKDDYMEWLDDMDAVFFIDHFDEINEIYLATTKTKSTAKKNTDKQNDE